MTSARLPPPPPLTPTSAEWRGRRQTARGAQPSAPLRRPACLPQLVSGSPGAIRNLHSPHATRLIQSCHQPVRWWRTTGWSLAGSCKLRDPGCFGEDGELMGRTSALWAEMGRFIFPLQVLVRLRLSTPDCPVLGPPCEPGRDISARRNRSRWKPSRLGPASPRPSGVPTPLYPGCGTCKLHVLGRQRPGAAVQMLNSASREAGSGCPAPSRSVLPAGVSRGFWDTQRRAPGNSGAPG